jgi:hypothetical protein
LKEIPYVVVLAALLIVSVLIVPAMAAHISGLTMTPEEDSVPAETCNAFTIDLMGTAETSDSTLPPEYVDVQVLDGDEDSENTPFTDESQSPIAFCAPASTPTPANGQQGGPNPQPTSTAAVNPVTPTANNDGACETSGNPGCDGTIQGETGPTDASGVVTFGIVSNVPGTYVVTGFYDEFDGETPGSGTGTFEDTSQKTFTVKPVPPQCGDGADNDLDGKTDYASDSTGDPGCTSATDNDETDGSSPPPQCSDGEDNDADGRIDYASNGSGDGGCTGLTDNDETGSGNRTRNTAITIRYNDGAFKGTVASASKLCKVDRRVFLKKQIPGEDPIARRTSTDFQGTWKIAHSRDEAQGKKWYAVAKAYEFENERGGTTYCLPVRSVTFTVTTKK